MTGLEQPSSLQDIIFLPKEKAPKKEPQCIRAATVAAPLKMFLGNATNSLTRYIRARSEGLGCGGVSPSHSASAICRVMRAWVRKRLRGRFGSTRARPHIFWQMTPRRGQLKQAVKLSG